MNERKWLDRFLGITPERPSVLDLGCGFGEPIGRYLWDHGGKITGVDASPELIEVAKNHQSAASWIVSDMRTLNLQSKFDGIVAWDSIFHFCPNDQREMFPIFRRHAAPSAALIFTSGPHHGETIGSFEGEPLYHASLDPAEDRELLDQNGFKVMDNVVEDPECGFHTVWLAQFQP